MCYILVLFIAHGFFSPNSNASLGLCQCENDDWKAIHKGIWSSVTSPYENRYLDVNLTGEVYGCITVSIVEGVVCLFKELTDQGAPCALLMLYYFLVFFYLTAIHFCAEPQQRRFISLGMGFLILLLAPLVSSWVPFYYSSSMAIGVLLAIILLFQVDHAARESGHERTSSRLSCAEFLLPGHQQWDLRVNCGIDRIILQLRWIHLSRVTPGLGFTQLS